MQSSAITPDKYIDELPEERKQAFIKLRSTIINNLPPGFQEVMGSGMICYVVPHSLYPPGYHCDPKQPLPFLGIASQKHFIAVYHMGIYAKQDLSKWFKREYEKQAIGKLDMGKSCIRFKKPEQITFKLIGDLASRMTPEDWITTYEAELKMGKSKT